MIILRRGIKFYLPTDTSISDLSSSKALVLVSPRASVLVGTGDTVAVSGLEKITFSGS